MKLKQKKNKNYLRWKSNYNIYLMFSSDLLDYLSFLRPEYLSVKFVISSEWINETI